MTVYTYYGNKNANDGTSSIIVASGEIQIGDSGDLTVQELANLSQRYIFVLGEADPDLSQFAWNRRGKTEASAATVDSPIHRSLLGIPNGIATLDNSGNVPSSQLGNAGGGGGASSTIVTADASVPNGASDNTAYLTGKLVTAIAMNGQLRIPKGTNGNWVINHLTLPSNSNVDAIGATFIQASGTNTRMIYNTSLTLGTPGSARDSNITWIGGTFIKGTGQQNVGDLIVPGALDDHTTMFGFVDGLTVRNMTVIQDGTGGNAGTGGRYGCYVWNCTNFVFDSFSATSLQGALNQSTLQIAFSQNGHIKNVFSNAGDDIVALVNGNHAGDILTNGLSHTENVHVENVYGVAPSNGVRIMPGSTAGSAPFYNVQNCTVNNVRVDAGSRGNAAAIFIGGNPSGSYPNLQNGISQNVEISNIRQLRANVPAVRIDGSADLSMTLKRVANLDDSTVVQVINGGGSSRQRVKIEDCVWNTTITSGSQYPISISSTTCRSLDLDNIQLQAATTGTATVGLINATAGPGWVVAKNIRTTGKCYALGTFASTTRFVADGINGEDANGLGYIQTNTGAVVTIRAWNGCFNAGANTNTIVAGTIATNDSRAPGASGTATLVAGTVVVNTGAGMVTASSQIRLTTLASGGTVGHCYISSRGANTFTITSTNAADTSTIFWEVVNS